MNIARLWGIYPSNMMMISILLLVYQRVVIIYGKLSGHVWFPLGKPCIKVHQQIPSHHLLSCFSMVLSRWNSHFSKWNPTFHHFSKWNPTFHHFSTWISLLFPSEHPPFSLLPGALRSVRHQLFGPGLQQHCRGAGWGESHWRRATTWVFGDVLQGCVSHCVSKENRGKTMGKP